MGGREAGRMGGKEAGRLGGWEAGRLGRVGGWEAGRVGGSDWYTASVITVQCCTIYTYLMLTQLD